MQMRRQHCVHARHKQCMFTSHAAWSAQMTNPLVYSSITNENITKIPTSCRACFCRGKGVVFLAYCRHLVLCKAVHFAWAQCKIWVLMFVPCILNGLSFRPRNAQHILTMNFISEVLHVSVIFREMQMHRDINIFRQTPWRCCSTYDTFFFFFAGPFEVSGYVVKVCHYKLIKLCSGKFISSQHLLK